MTFFSRRAATPIQESDIMRYYSMMIPNPAEETRYINLGYWQDNPPSYHVACDTLATMLGLAAPFEPSDEILDVGFGFGEQDISWARRFRPKRIVGLNLHEDQVREAKRYVAEQGLEDVVDLRWGNATAMELADNSFDKVVALECAFHFVTRDAFFREAFRVLRPGGCLVTADVIALPVDNAWNAWMMEQTRALIRIPEANWYTRRTYAHRLEEAGFESITTTSIRNEVFVPCYTYWARRLRSRPTGTLPVPKDVERLWQPGEAGAAYRRAYATTVIPVMLLGALLSNPVTEPFTLGLVGMYAPDYIIARAVKP